jgi:hypothetical protein
VIPIAATASLPIAVTTSCKVSDTADQISVASCSTHLVVGSACANSRCNAPGRPARRPRPCARRWSLRHRQHDGHAQRACRPEQPGERDQLLDRETKLEDETTSITTTTSTCTW